MNVGVTGNIRLGRDSTSESSAGHDGTTHGKYVTVLGGLGTVSEVMTMSPFERCGGRGDEGEMEARRWGNECVRGGNASFLSHPGPGAKMMANHLPAANCAASLAIGGGATFVVAEAKSLPPAIWKRAQSPRRSTALTGDIISFDSSID